MRSLEKRVQQLEDIEAIRRLKVRYAQLCDANFDANGIAELFTEDGVWEGEPFGVYKGRDAVRNYFAEVGKDISFSLHYMIGHMIDVEPSGDEATGVWYVWNPATIKGRAVWLAAIYEDRYRRVNGRWLFSYVKSNLAFMTPYESGWVKERVIA